MQCLESLIVNQGSKLHHCSDHLLEDSIKDSTLKEDLKVTSTVTEQTGVAELVVKIWDRHTHRQTYTQTNTHTDRYIHEGVCRVTPQLKSSRILKGGHNQDISDKMLKK